MTALDDGQQTQVAWHDSDRTSVPEGADHQPARSAEPVDRLGAIWNGKWRILLVAVLVALLTLGITALLPRTYSSSVQVALNASPVSGASVTDVTTAGNDLAAQYAQVVSTEVVLQPAAAAVGTTSASLHDRVKATTVASQNVILLTVQARGRDQAQQEATALGNSLVAYVTENGAATADRYRKQIETQLAPLDAQIVAAKRKVDSISSSLAKIDSKTTPQAVSAASARLSSAQQLYSSLNDRRTGLATQATVQAVSLAPQAVVLGPSSAATQVEPRPALYTAIAGLLGLVIAAQLVVTLSERRDRLARARSGR